MLEIANGWRQVPIPPHVAQRLEPGCKQYHMDLSDGHLMVLVGHSKQSGWHLSISHRLSIVNERGNHMPGRYPTWDEIKSARYAFVPNDAYMAMILPPKEEFVNIHPTTFHLYEVPELETRKE